MKGEKREWNLIWKKKNLYMRPSQEEFMDNSFSVEGSAIWNAVQMAKSWATPGRMWKLVNGRIIRFWEDRWLLDKPLKDIPIAS